METKIFFKREILCPQWLMNGENLNRVIHKGYDFITFKMYL